MMKTARNTTVILSEVEGRQKSERRMLLFRSARQKKVSKVECVIFQRKIK